MLRLGDAVVVERGGASDAVVDELLALHDPTDGSAVLGVIDAKESLGPGILHHGPEREIAAAALADQDVSLVDDPTALRSWLAGLSSEDVSDSSADELDRVFVIRDHGSPVAIAGWVVWPHDTAHLGVLVDPAHRGRGLSVIVGAAATTAALDEGLHPQWRAAETNTRSRRAAATLGYVETGQQFSLRHPVVVPQLGHRPRHAAGGRPSTP